jgi:hypothetical protein
MTIVESAREPEAAVTQAQVPNPKEPIGRPFVSFDASRGRRTRSDPNAGVASLFRRLLGGRGG